MKDRSISQKGGFSLPEILITLVIIGIVSAAVIPNLVRNFNERMNTEKEVNIAHKITQALDNMNAAGDLNYYNTTEDFVEALSKHLKIVKICDNEHLGDCWSSKVVRTSGGGSYNVSDAKTGQSLHTANITNNVGIVLADGTQIILTYDPSVGAKAGDNITPSSKVLPVGFGKKKTFLYTTSITGGIDYVTDVNGSAGPNAETTDAGEYNDIRSFRVASFSNAMCPGELVNGVCVYNLGTNYPPINCTGSENEQYCDGEGGILTDYLGGRHKACSMLGMKVANCGELTAITPYTDVIPPGTYGYDYGSFTLRDDGTRGCSSNTKGWVRDKLYKIVCIR